MFVLEGLLTNSTFYTLAMQAQPEGSWLWVLDSDIVLMDMQNGLERLISIAEHKKAEFMVANWDCGDGFNMGSIMMKNTEWTRGIMQRIKDMRVVWQLYFYHSATGNTEQGAFWTLMMGDPDWQEKVWDVPPRSLNCRHKAIECARNSELVGKVYFHPGDFMIHFAALIRGDVGMKLFLDSMRTTGWWPCPKDKCHSGLLKTVFRAVAHSKSPAAVESVAESLDTKNSITLVLVDNSTNAASSTSTAGFAKSKGFSFKHFADDVLLYDGSRVCASGFKGCTQVQARQSNWQSFAKTRTAEYNDDSGLDDVSDCKRMSTERFLTCFGLFTSRNQVMYKVVVPGKDEAEDVQEGVLFWTTDGYARVAAARKVLKGFESASSNNQQQWLLLLGADELPSTGSSLHATLNQVVSTPAHQVRYRIAVHHNCQGPWLIRAGEWARLLMSRVSDGYLLRAARLSSKTGSRAEERNAADYVNPLLSAEETASAAQALCLLLARDQSTAKHVNWLG